MGKTTILLVEDDQAAVDLIRTILSEEHYSIQVAGRAAQGRTMVEKNRPDLLILDRNLPDRDGLELCKELRQSPATSSLPILMLTSRKGITDKVMGLTLGADDYLAKPFHPQELVARVQVLLRRTSSAAPAAPIYEAGVLRLDPVGRIVCVGKKELSLTKTEFDLLQTFFERSGRVLTRTFLLSHVWGYETGAEINANAVDVMMMGLRQKLGKCGEYIETVKGYGYRFRRPGEPLGR